MGQPRATGMILAATCLAMPAAAQITAEDVWANQQAAVTATGGTLQGRLERDGDTVTVHDHLMIWNLPSGAGELLIETEPFSMVELPDGSVRFDFAQNLLAGYVEASAGLLDIGFSSWIEVDLAGADWTARGEPALIRYDNRAERLNASIITRGQSGGFAPVEFAHDVTLSITDPSSVVIVSTGAETAIEIGSRSLETRLETHLTDDSGLDDRSVGVTGPSESYLRAILPAGLTESGSVAGALRDGLSVIASSSIEFDMSQAITRHNGAVASDQSQIMQGGMFRLSVDASGLSSFLRIDDLSFDLREPDMLGTIQLHGRDIQFDLTVPLLAAADPQGFLLRLGVDELTLGAETWGSLDPGGALDPGPFGMMLDIEGAVALDADPVDFGRFAAAFDTGNPMRLVGVTVQDSFIEGLGLRGTAEGAFSVSEDPPELMGMPLPEGTGTATIDGASGLIDRLSAAGLIAGNEARAARLALAAFGRATGADRVTTDLVVGADGSITLNGMPLR